MKAERSIWILIGSMLFAGCAPEPETLASVGASLPFPGFAGQAGARERGYTADLEVLGAPGLIQRSKEENALGALSKNSLAPIDRNAATLWLQGVAEEGGCPR